MNYFRNDNPIPYNCWPCYIQSTNQFNQYPQTYNYVGNSIDQGPNPLVLNIEDATVQNNTFRTALWTGNHFQLTLMSIQPCDDIGLEIHPDVDQFIRIEQGQAMVLMGDQKDNLNYRQIAADDYAIIIPAGKWHNIVNIGHEPLKLYSIYAPPEHPKNTVHVTKKDALAAESHIHHKN